MNKIYLGSIALEKNRWAPGRIPTYNVSDFVTRANDDGFAGIELWEYHYHLADETEREKLANSGTEFIFNTYFNLAEGITDDIIKVADAVNQLGAVAMKYNFPHIDYGVDMPTIMKHRDTLLKFADMLKGDVKLLCECHGWTSMEVPERAAEVLASLDERFGAIIHLATEPEFARKCFECYGERICHIHTAASTENGFVHLEDKDELMRGNLDYFVSKGFNGTMTLEFIKDADDMNDYYANALRDFEYLKKIYK